MRLEETVLLSRDRERSKSREWAIQHEQMSQAKSSDSTPDCGWLLLNTDNYQSDISGKAESKTRNE